MQETGNAATMTEEQFVAVQRWFNEYCEDFRSAIADVKTAGYKVARVEIEAEAVV